MGNLILSVKEGGKVFIGETELIVLEIRSGKVKLGLLADQDIRIEREEKRDAA